MIPIAGVLLLIIVVFTIAVVVSNPTVFDLSLLGAHIPVNTAGVYFTGAGAMLVLILALGLLRTGLKRERARRRHVKALRSAAGGHPLPTPTAKKTSSSSSTPAAASHTTASDTHSAEPAQATAQTSSLDLGPESKTSAAERRALLDEAEELTGDNAER